MIGRAALGNPWIFSQVREYLEEGTRTFQGPSAEERRSLMLRHLHVLIAFTGDPVASIRIMRKHLAWYTKGLPGGAHFRDAINRLESRAAVEDTIEAYFDRLRTAGAAAFAPGDLRGDDPGPDGDAHLEPKACG
jgi:tRNA-dihydrouridine synthase B